MQAWQIIWLLVAVGILCGRGVVGDERTPVSYQKDVLPIFRTECLACHNEDEKEGELDLSSYVGVMEGGASGAVIDPGDPDESRLYRLVSHRDQPSMPPETPMIAIESIELIKQWITAGAVETSAEVVDSQEPHGVKVYLPVPAPLGEGLEHLPPRLPRASYHTAINGSAVLALAASPTSPLIAVGGTRQFLLYRTDNLTQLGCMRFDHGDIRVLQFSPDGSLLLVAGGHPGRSGKVDVWEIEKGQRLFSIGETLDEVRACALSRDHRRLALSSTDSIITLYDLPSGRILRKLKGHNDWVTDLKFSDDGVLLASADRGGGLHLWEGWTGNLYKTLAGHKQPIHSLAWTANSDYVSSAGADGFVRIWSAEDGAEQTKFKAHEQGVVRHLRHPAGGWVTAGIDRKIGIWNAEGQSVRQFTPFTEQPTSLAWCRVTGRVIAGDYLGRVTVHDGQSAEMLGLYQANPESLSAQIARMRSAHARMDADRDRALKERNTAEQKMQEIQQRASHAESEYHRSASAASQIRDKVLVAKRTQRKCERQIAEASVTHKPSQTVSKLLIRSKMAKDKATLLSGVYQDAMQTVASLEDASTQATKRSREAARELEMMQQRLQQAKAQAGKALLALAKLVEEAAYATAYDALQIRRELRDELRSAAGG